MIEYVIKKAEEFKGIAYTILENGKVPWSGQPREEFLTDEFILLSQDELDKKVKEFCEHICGKWKEISEERYNEKLNILPPTNWYAGGFYISEAYVLNVHPYYQTYCDGYYEALFRLNTPRDQIMWSLSEFINAQKKIIKNN